MQGKLADTHSCEMESLPQSIAPYPLTCLRVIWLCESLSDCACVLTELTLADDDEVFNMGVMAVLAGYFVNNLSQAWRLQRLLFNTVS